jgi:hypothetical protein
MLNKDQAFIAHEFVRDNAYEQVWKVQEKLFKLMDEILKAQPSFTQEVETTEANTI